MGLWAQIALCDNRERFPMTTGQSGVQESKKKRIIMMILLAVLLMSVSMFLVQRDDARTIIIAFPNGIEIEAEVADTPEKLLFGMAFHDALDRKSTRLNSSHMSISYAVFCLKK